MKTQYINIDQALSAISSLLITSIAGLKWVNLFSAFKLSPNKIGNYLLPLLKQLFKDNFMGSEMEMGILLLFVKSYFLIAVFAITHNPLVDQFKKLRLSINKSAVLQHRDYYQHNQVA
jgi:hypothetical protein